MFSGGKSARKEKVSQGRKGVLQFLQFCENEKPRTNAKGDEGGKTDQQMWLKLFASAFSQPVPNLFGALSILDKGHTIRPNLDQLGVVTLDDTRQEIPKRWKP